MRLLFEDFSYAVLPIVIIAMVYRLIGESFQGFLLLKEWSFAAIVLWGASLLRFVRVKVDVQRSRDHVQREVGIQLMVLALVVSVLVLALVVLEEHGKLGNVNLTFTARLQLALFCLGALALLGSIVAEEAFSAVADRLPWSRSPSERSQHLGYRLAAAVETLGYCRSAADLLAAGPHPEEWQETQAKISEAEALLRQAFRSMPGRG